MTARDQEKLEPRWARLGVLLHGAPAPRSPDLERLLLETARRVEGNARLLPIVVSWLAAYGGFVARHRLKRLVAAELEPRHRPALGLILESAIGHGAPRDLAIALEACRPGTTPRPLFLAQRGNAPLEAVAERNASSLSRKWGVWAPDIELKRDAIRPVAWLLSRNPEYRDRIVRKGDLRCSILETLRRDAGGRVRSESELARLCCATRTAVRKALGALTREGEVTIERPPGNDRDHAITLRTAA